MFNKNRIASVSAAVALVASLAACAPMGPQASYPGSAYPQGQQGAYPTTSYPAPSYPTATYPAGTYPAQNQQGAYIEYGRVSNIEVFQTQAQGQGTGAGALIGGVAGAVVGRQIGGGSGKDAATIVGALGGAVAGNAIEKNRNAGVTETYRISVQMDNGTYRSYDMPSQGQLRTGDRVRIENGQVFRLM